MEIIRAFPGKFQAVALSSHSRAEELVALGKEFGAESLALSGTRGGQDEKQNQAAAGRPRPYAPDGQNCAPSPTGTAIKYSGEEGLLSMIEETRADIVVNGISGSAGFLPSIAALKTGKTLALANKETLVMAGSLVKKIAKENRAAIIPVDSEHSAVFQLSRAFGEEAIESVILTASGGPFRDLSMEELSRVTPKDALRHPTWNMGKKITIDSSTLANKGLEVIEAHHLFGLAPEKIKVLVHPQSYVHSLIETRDGMQYAQIGKPDMKVPILNALCFPDDCAWTPGRFSLAGMSLTFAGPDTQRFPLLELAYECLRRGESWPLVYNAANEAAVAAFLDGSIPFTAIAQLVSKTLNSRKWPSFSDVQEVLGLDSEARKTARQAI